MMARGECKHPREDRTMAADNYHRVCGKCGRTFLPRDARPPHGTYAGYGFHQRYRKGQWGWPLEKKTCGCFEAGQKQRRKYARKDKTARILRGRARSQALSRLRFLYPGLYNRIYAEKLTGTTVPHPPESPVWDELVARLVKASTGDTEDSIAQRQRLRNATRSEIEILRYAQRIRSLFYYLTEYGDAEVLEKAAQILAAQGVTEDYEAEARSVLLRHARRLRLEERADASSALYGPGLAGWLEARNS